MIAVVIWFARQKTARKDSARFKRQRRSDAKFQQFLSRGSNPQ